MGKVKGVMDTTHVDSRGDKLTRDDLEARVSAFYSSEQPSWINWDHQTTIPPIGIIKNLAVEPRDDGEFQLVFDGELFDDDIYELLPSSKIEGLRISYDQITQILSEIESSPNGNLEIIYDKVNYNPEQVKPILDSLNEIVPTESNLFVRKSEIPQAVIWVFVAFAGGFMARFGELTADKAIQSTKEFYKKLNDRFSKFLQINPTKPDVIFGVDIPESSVVVEGALEQANKEILEIVWAKLPELYAIATHLIRQNPKNYFSQIKFLFNPQSKKWEINYLTLRKSGRIIQGPRYYEPNHPLRERWEKELERITNESGK